jgi:hypothetical protein
MTREEKILEILNNQRMKHFGAISPMNYPELVLELASLPLDVPTEEEIKHEIPILENDAYWFKKGVIATLSEIEKRNK